MQLSSLSDLVSEGAPVSTAPAVVLTVLAGPGFADESGSGERAESVRSGTLETSTGLQDHDRANKICADY